MASYLLHENAIVQCAHAGQARPTQTSSRVTVAGNAIVTQPAPYRISGCSLASTSSPPCVTAQWTTVATRVKAEGQPVVLMESQAICTPTGNPLTVVTTQIRVRGV